MRGGGHKVSMGHGGGVQAGCRYQSCNVGNVGQEEGTICPRNLTHSLEIDRAGICRGSHGDELWVFPWPPEDSIDS